MQYNNDITNAIFLGIGTMVLLFLAVSLQGILLFFIWPVAVSVFPKLVFEGYILSNISFIQALCVSWFWGLLFAPKVINKKS